MWPSGLRERDEGGRGEWMQRWVGGGRVGVCKVRGCEGVWEVVRGRVGV